MKRIEKAQFVSEYIMHMIGAAIVGVVIYGIVTFIICKIQKKEREKDTGYVPGWRYGIVRVTFAGAGEASV